MHISVVSMWGSVYTSTLPSEASGVRVPGVTSGCELCDMDVWK